MKRHGLKLHDRELAEIMHDLRSPLAAIEGTALEAIGSEERDCHKHLERWQHVAAAVDDLFRLIENALVARSVGSFVGDEFSPFDVTQLLRKIEAQWRGKFALATVGLRVLIQDEIFLLGSQSMLQRAITNLVENALLHSFSGDTVEISVAQLGSSIFLTVANIHESLRVGIEKNLRQVATCVPRIGIRFGLGISSATRIVKKHGGSLITQNRQQGWRTIIVLPIKSVAGE